MKIIIKLASRDYKKLRSRIPSGSPVHEAIERATRIDYSLEASCSKAITFHATRATRACYWRLPCSLVPKLSPRFRKRCGSPSPAVSKCNFTQLGSYTRAYELIGRRANLIAIRGYETKVGQISKSREDEF